MIVKMLKIYIAARDTDRDKLLPALGELGAVHLNGVDAEKTPEEEKILAELGETDRAIQILSNVTPTGDGLKIAPEDAVSETTSLQRKNAEMHNRLTNLHRQLGALTGWGDVKLEQIEQLRSAGIDVRFYSVPNKSPDKIEAECVAVLGPLASKCTLTAVVDRPGNASIPDQAELLELPPRDAPSIRAEAAQIDTELKNGNARLAELANLIGQIGDYREQLQSRADYTQAVNGALSGEHIFALRGWIPADKAESLASHLAQAGLDAAVHTIKPDDDETPPTLIQYPKWAKPIKGLFDILGTVSGYREFDVSAPFMLALPIFAAMLIGDGGYGAILLIATLVFFKKCSQILGAPFTRLMTVIGAVTLVWGMVNATFFGVVLYTPLLPVDMTSRSCDLIMRISFFMGAIHLSIAQLWRGVSYWPSLKMFSTVGWVIFIWGMLGVVKHFVLGDPKPYVPPSPWFYLLVVGAALAILFEHPCRNPLKMIGLGLANFPLSALSAFSDVISYIRLMAVGLASSVLASSFNDLALGTESWFLAVPILLMGHGLNMALALIAIFAHGVRLNMLEFSNNLGMQWAGYQYQPFAQPGSKET